MRFHRKRAVFAFATLLFVGGCLHSPMLWSPDGKWLAYNVEVRPIDQMIQPGWIFGDTVPRTRNGLKAPTSYRLYATRFDDGTSVLLEESSKPMTAPGWRPDGRALAVGEVIVGADGKARFEVVILEGPTNRRVISSRVLPELTDDAMRLPAQAIAWSPDGRYLAVPQLSPRGLAILRADNGRQVNTIADAFLPSWSPDSTRMAFYIRGTGDSLQCIDSALGQPRSLTEVGTAGQAPIWTRDALNLIVVTRRPINRDGDAPSEQAELVRVPVDSGQSQVMFPPLTGDLGLARIRTLEGTSIALDKTGENLFCSTHVEGQANEIIWFRPRDGSTYKRFMIIDQWTPTGSLSVSPDGRTLAARVGSIDHLSPPVLCDLDSENQRSKLTAPDDASRVEWIATLVESAKRILAGLPVASTDPGRPAGTRVARPTILPILGEFETNSEPPGRLRKIGRLGRPLCDRPSDAPPPEPALVAILDEARLFFDYLKEDYPAALADLEPLEASAETPERRLDLLTIRAQIFLNGGKLERAARTIAYLRESDRKPVRRIEPTATGDRLVDVPVEGRGWPDYLALRSIKIKAILIDDEADHVNPDAPRAMFPNAPPGPILPNFPFLEQPIDPNRRGLRLIRPGEVPNGIPKL